MKTYTLHRVSVRLVFKSHEVLLFRGFFHFWHVLKRKELSALPALSVDYACPERSKKKQIKFDFYKCNC